MNLEQLSICKKRKLIETKLLFDAGDVFNFAEDYLFTSPSAAASRVLACKANGWLEWKDAQGKTIDELYRKQ